MTRPRALSKATPVAENHRRSIPLRIAHLPEEDSNLQQSGEQLLKKTANNAVCRCKPDCCQVRVLHGRPHRTRTPGLVSVSRNANASAKPTVETGTTQAVCPRPFQIVHWH